MNNFSRQGLVTFLAAAFTTTSVAEQPSECDDSQPFRDFPFPGNSTTAGFCPGIDVVFRSTCPNQLCDFPGNFPTEPLLVTP